MSRLDGVNAKIVNSEQAARLIHGWKMKGDLVVFTNGCFDILHRGHVSYLANAASEGQRLVIGLNTDESVKAQNKGANRPINDEDSRSIVIAGLGFVDLVVLFDSDTPLTLIQELKPNVLVKGGDYDANETDQSAASYIVGSDIVKADGGAVKTIQFVDGFSTSSLIEKIRIAE